jgi:hypothetical protein
VAAARQREQPAGATKGQEGGHPLRKGLAERDVQGFSTILYSS